MRQTWILIIISNFFVIGHCNHVLLIGVYDIDASIRQEKFFFWPFFVESKLIRQMRQTWILIIISIFYDRALQSSSSHQDSQYQCFGLTRKALLSIIFLTIKVHPSNETNLDPVIISIFFGNGHCNHVLFNRIHDICALVWQEKLFSLLFSL